MNYKFYNELVQDAIFIREEVFVKEQGFQNEFDDIDHHCLHLVVYKDDKAIGCARMFEEHKKMTLGRIAVLKDYRKQNVGTYIMKQLEHKAKELGYSITALSAQVRASDFYKNQGYVQSGEEYYDEYCPHIHMEKIL